jgi:hypothetical protein
VHSQSMKAHALRRANPGRACQDHEFRQTADRTTRA